MANQLQETWWIVAADGSRARFFDLRMPRDPEIEGGPDLVEREDLVNPEHVLRPSERFSDSKSGGNRAAGGGPTHGYDDHRSRNAHENEARFARRLADTLCALIARTPPRHLVLSADPRLLGLLRSALEGRLPHALDVKQVAKDFSGLTRPELHARLAASGLVPRREAPPSGATRRS